MRSLVAERCAARWHGNLQQKALSTNDMRSSTGEAPHMHAAWTITRGRNACASECVCAWVVYLCTFLSVALGGRVWLFLFSSREFRDTVVKHDISGRVNALEILVKNWGDWAALDAHLRPRLIKVTCEWIIISILSTWVTRRLLHENSLASYLRGFSTVARWTPLASGWLHFECNFYTSKRHATDNSLFCPIIAGT